MPRVTGLAPDPRRPGYRLVYVDRGRFASLPADRVAALELAEDMDLPARTFTRLRELADEESALRAALRALARRGHARQDLRRRLIQRQHPPAALDAAFGRLAEQGLLDDARFAREFAASRARRGRGPARLVRDLVAQGVARRVAEEAVRGALAEEHLDPAETARRAAEKRAEQLRDLPVAVRKRRLLGFLKRRGFEGAELRETIEQLCRI